MRVVHRGKPQHYNRSTFLLTRGRFDGSTKHWPHLPKPKYSRWNCKEVDRSSGSLYIGPCVITSISVFGPCNIQINQECKGFIAHVNINHFSVSDSDGVYIYKMEKHIQLACFGGSPMGCLARCTALLEFSLAVLISLVTQDRNWWVRHGFAFHYIDSVYQ